MGHSVCPRIPRIPDFPHFPFIMHLSWISGTSPRIICRRAIANVVVFRKN